MITELTAAQKARFPEFVEKWTRIGLCTDPADRAKAEEGVRLAYRNTGLEPPGKIVWCGSPLSMGLHVTIRESAQEAGIEPVGSSVSGPTWVENLFRESVRESVYSSVWSSVYSSVWSSVGNVGTSVVNMTDHGRGALVHDFFVVEYCVSWYAFCDYFRVVCGLTEQTENMLGKAQVAENAGWWMPCKDICWISERPNRLKLDDRWRLHCEDGPALTYPDGFSIYAIHGVLVGERLVMRPESQDVDVIRNEPDAEVKRIRIERFGWAEYLRAVGAVVIDTRHNEVEATEEALMRTPDGQVVLVCSCPSTARVYSLEVPPTITTCEAAQDWLSGGLAQRVINGA